MYIVLYYILYCRAVARGRPWVPVLLPRLLPSHPMDGVVVPPHLCQWWELDPPNAAVVVRAEDAARGTSKRPRKEEEEVVRESFV